VISLRRHWKPLLLVLVLGPTILFAGSYAVGSAAGSHSERYTQAPGPWNVNMTINHPSYVVSGQQVVVTLTLGVSAPDSNYSVGVNDMAVELREPTTINSTSNIVTSWAVLGSGRTNVNQNYTGARLVRVVSVMATMPPTNGALDLLSPTSNVAFNGVVDFTVYQKERNVTSASPQSISLIDSVTYYRSQLSTIASTSSWVTYQLLAALAGLAIFVRYRPLSLGVAVDTYTLGLQSYRAERALSRLDEMLKSGMVGKQRYEELKQGFAKELDRLRGESRQ
jgi:hypothetical protein